MLKGGWGSVLVLPLDTRIGVADDSKLLLIVVTDRVNSGLVLVDCGVFVNTVDGIGAGVLVSGEGSAIVGPGAAEVVTAAGVVGAAMGEE